MKQFHCGYDFGQKHINSIMVAINGLGALQFNNFLSYIFFFEIQFNGEYKSDSCQIRMSNNSWGINECKGVGLIMGGPT